MRSTAKQALQHKFLRSQAEVCSMDLPTAQRDDDECELAFELTDDNIPHFVAAYCPKLKRLL
jgi:hypothetical protein